MIRRLLIAALIALCFVCASASAAISFRSAASANTTNVAITTPAANDLLIVFAYRNGAAAPSLATGYTNLDTSSNGSNSSARIGYKLSDGTETTSGTWTSATQVVCSIYRGVSTVTPIGTISAATTGAGSAILTYTGLTLTNLGGSNTSWVAGFGGARGAASGMNGTTTALTSNRTSVTTANGLDTNATVTSFASSTLTISGSGVWVTWTVEIQAPAAAPASAATGLLLMGVGH